MPGLAQRNEQLTNDSSQCTLSANGFWSKNSNDVSYNQLQKVLEFSAFYFLFLIGFWIVAGLLFLIDCCVNSDELVEFILDLTVGTFV